VSRNRGLKMVVNALLSSMTGVVHVSVVLFIFFLIFSILGVSFYKGTFYACQGETFDSLSPEQHHLITHPRPWSLLSPDEKAWVPGMAYLQTESGEVLYQLPGSRIRLDGSSDFSAHSGNVSKLQASAQFEGGGGLSAPDFGADFGADFGGGGTANVSTPPNSQPITSPNAWMRNASSSVNMSTDPIVDTRANQSITEVIFTANYTAGNSSDNSSYSANPFGSSNASANLNGNRSSSSYNVSTSPSRADGEETGVVLIADETRNEPLGGSSAATSNTTTSTTSMAQRPPLRPNVSALSTAAGAIVPPDSRTVCLWLGADWEEVIAQNFNNVAAGMVTLFEMSTTEGWVDVMLAAVDQRGIGMQPVVRTWDPAPITSLPPSLP
jgi:hypothetical protein